MVSKTIKKLKSKIYELNINSKKKNKKFKRNNINKQKGGQTSNNTSVGDIGNVSNLGDLNSSPNDFDLNNSNQDLDFTNTNNSNNYNNNGTKKVIKTGPYNKTPKESEELTAIEREQLKARQGLSVVLPPINTTKEEALLEKTENKRILGFGNYQHILDESVKPKFTSEGFYPSYLSFNEIQKINLEALELEKNKNKKSNKNSNKNKTNNNVNNSIKELDEASTTSEVLEEAGNLALEGAVL